MTILGNIHGADLGRPVQALTTEHRRHAADFPGWGAPGYAAFLLPIPAGMAGEITSVESHGSNPWTRYSVRFADGTTASGLCLGSDIAFADGYPLQRTWCGCGEAPRHTSRVHPGGDPR